MPSLHPVPAPSRSAPPPPHRWVAPALLCAVLGYLLLAAWLFAPGWERAFRSDQSPAAWLSGALLLALSACAQQPPKDFAPVHQAFREHRGQIGRGGPLPAGIKIQKGKPLPHGYGKRLDARALKGLPHYPGYEWRRVGSDIVLITVTSGIVYTILQGVLD